MKLATAARRKALDWTNEAIDLIMTVLAQTDANQFVDLLISGFGFEDPGILQEDEEEGAKEPKAKDPSQVKGSMKHATEGTSVEPPAKRLRSSTAELRNPITLKKMPSIPLEANEIRIVKPTSKESLLHTGVPDFFSYRIKDGPHKGSYRCAYQEFAESQGLPLDEEECKFRAGNKNGTTIHLRRCHLGVALQCPVCPKIHRYFDAAYWRKHMEEKHQDIPEAQWYVLNTSSNPDLILVYFIRTDTCSLD